MWQSTLGFIIKIILDWIAAHVNKWMSRKKEQTERHGDNQGKIEDYKNAEKDSARDTFSRLP